jgi:Caspase domain
VTRKNVMGVLSWSRFLITTGGALILAALIAASPAHADRRVALIIGNSAYMNVPRLANPDNDARLMAETLRSLGFTLVGGSAQLDLNEDGFRRVVEEFGKQLQGANVGLFYYAGHGVQVHGENYLVPIDSNPTKEADVDFQMLDANLVLRQMEGAGTKLNLVILDACRNNPFGGRGLRTTGGGLAQMQAPEGTLISFATQPGSIAQDGRDGHSPYTEALAQIMHKPGLDIFRTFNDVGLAVTSETAGAQQPWFSSSPIKGDFYFSGRSITIEPAGASNDHLSPVIEKAADGAERAWPTIKDTTSVAVLEDFIRQFGGTTYGSMARARLEELKKARDLAKKTQSTAITHGDGSPIISNIGGNVEIKISK